MGPEKSSGPKGWEEDSVPKLRRAAGEASVEMVAEEAEEGMSGAG